MVLELVLVAHMATVTSYRSIPEQTDDSPFYTSIGEHVAQGGCAVSPDLLKSSAPYGSYLYIQDVGICRVNDVTNARLRGVVDVWMPDYQHEKRFGVKHKPVYKIKFPRGGNK
jgi:3D (Asp-Asp-Asp) domain-containing protein